LKRIAIILLVLLCSCGYFHKSKKGDAVAKAYDKYLYLADLKGIIPPGTDKKDSISITKNFINNWIRQQILIHQAESNLPDDQKDFTEQLESYRNSLIIYQYETELIKQKLDTIISKQEIEKYYKDNQSNFVLRQNIVQANWVRVKPGFKGEAKLKKMLVSNRGNDKNKLEEFCQKNASDFSLDDGKWISFDELIKTIPIKTTDQEAYLKKNSVIELKDSLFVYYVVFKNYKTGESTSPLSFEEKNIREIILNKRRLQLVDKMQNEVFEKALKKNDFEIY